MNRKYEQWDNKIIIRAYRLLFAGNDDFSMEQMKRLNLSALKGAFREKVKEAHPDRSKALGIRPEILNEKFSKGRKNPETWEG